MAKPWYTSDELVSAIQKNISFPVDQNTLTAEDILEFANQEMKISMVPQILIYHQEYFVRTNGIPIQSNISKYPIPGRAAGEKLRDVMYGDGSTTSQLPWGNLFEMSRIDPGDKAYFQETDSNYPGILKFYLEGNNIVLIPTVGANVIGYLVVSYYLRPNELVPNERAFIVNNFSKTITIDNTQTAVGDTILINNNVFTAVSGAPSSFQYNLGVTATQTATNITTAINSVSDQVLATADNGNPASNVTTVSYDARVFSFSTSNVLAYTIQGTIGLVGQDTVPNNIVSLSFVDLIQTPAGHSTFSYDVVVPRNGVSGNTLSLREEDVPYNFLLGDYVCSQYESIIPQIPSDLHISLIEKVSARVLRSIGDLDGLQTVNAKLADINQAQAELIDQRVDGAPQKVFNKRSFMRMNKINRRLF